MICVTVWQDFSVKYGPDMFLTNSPLQCFTNNRKNLGKETDKTINGANMIWGNNLLKGFCPYLHQGCWITLLSHLHSSFTHTDRSTILQMIPPYPLIFILYDECVYLFEGVEKTPSMTSLPCMRMMGLVDCSRLK